MVSLASLWLPILLSAVLVFVVSALVHMVLPIHRKDFAQLPGEANVLEAMRKENVASGDYVFPCPQSMKEMKSPEMMKKYEQGPVGFLTIIPSGPPAMGASLVQWFVYSLVVGVFIAYLASRTLIAGTEYLQVFRVAGTAAFLAYAGTQPVQSIWGKRKWSTTAKHVMDGFLYALVTAGAFAGFWPE